MKGVPESGWPATSTEHRPLAAGQHPNVRRIGRAWGKDWKGFIHLEGSAAEEIIT